MIQSYLKPYKNYFWEWDEDAMFSDEGHPLYLVTLSNGQSIAYYNSILEVLEDLSPQRIPPFGALLLVLLAVNNGIQEPTFNKFKTDFLEEHGTSNKTILNAIKVLEYIRALPNTYKTGETKTELIQLLFKDCHNRLGFKKSQQLVREAKKGLREHIVYQDKAEVNQNLINQDVRPIALLLRRFNSTEDIINAIRKVPVNKVFSETIEIENNLSIESDIDKTFIEQLREHHKTYQIGSLIKRIWSGLNIPMHNNLPSNQPLGGVSDITNKGDFSRLLISEFAHDDDVFMSRVVNNEALYIERETPPENNTKERVFLIDNSIKNWGVPKVLSFATTLAIATHPKSDFKYHVYVVGETYTEISINSRLEVVESQHVLSGVLDCAKGIEMYFEENEANNSRELFFLTEEENLNSHSLQHSINTNYNAINYIITNNLKGDIHFYKHQNKSRKHFQHIVLPYQDIWDSEKPKPKIVKPSKNKDLALKDLLLEPIDKTNCRVIPFENEIYVLQNSNVYSLTSKGATKGLQLIYEGVLWNSAYQYTIIKNEKDECILVSFSKIFKDIQQLNLTTKQFFNKRIYSKGFEYAPLFMFSYDNKVIITNKTESWSIKKDSKLYKLDLNSNYQETLFNYQETISNFKRQLKINKVNYQILKNVDTINITFDSIDNFFIMFSDFILEETKLNSKKTSIIYYGPTQFDILFNAKTTLYLKRIDGNYLEVIKHLKEILKIELKEAKALVDNTPTSIIKDVSIEKAQELKIKIEKHGAVCYTKTDYFETQDGSSIHIENSQFIFKSSNSTIPQFYITALLNCEIAMATEGEFAGNEYFLPVNHKLTTIRFNDFYTKYINPFIKNIIAHED